MVDISDYSVAFATVKYQLTRMQCYLLGSSIDEMNAPEILVLYGAGPVVLTVLGCCLVMV